MSTPERPDPAASATTAPADTSSPKPAKPSPRGADLLVWLDMEMTGLDPATCRPIEIATIITDGELELVAEGPNLVIHQSDELLSAMDTWNTEHHRKSGLTKAVRASTLGEAEAMEQTLEFLRGHLDPGLSPCCGNSIGQDRRFLRRYMPELDAFFHYRSIDISTIKELVRRWYNLAPPDKTSAHRALDDIKESIEELRWYRRAVFRGTPVLGEIGIASESQ
jgi:oligoribonuclease